jgi:thioredoxin-dependent peroxiredoxin
MTFNSTRLTTGVVAPMFTTSDIFDQPIDLATYAGQPVLLSFFRNAACAVCNLRVHQLIQRHARYHAARLVVLTVFESPAEAIRQYVGKQDAPFAIIADPQAELYRLYEVETSHERVEASKTHPITGGVIQAAAEIGYALTPEPGSNFFRMPADFLIDTQGIVQHAFYSDILGEHVPFDTLEAFLEA